MFKKILLIFTLIFAPCFVSSEEDSRPQNFQQAKNIAKNIFFFYPETIYSGCKLDNKKHIDFNSCTFVPNQKLTRDVKIEFEHILPMAHAKYHFRCWRESLCIDKYGRRFKGRRCCQKIDPRFQQLEGELYNLWPEIGSINQARSNFKFTQFSTIERELFGKYRNLPIYIDFKHRMLEPRDKVKGLVARANLYVARKYNIRLSKAQLKLFQAWNAKYPPTEMELKWAARIAEITGEENKFITFWGQDV